MWFVKDKKNCNKLLIKTIKDLLKGRELLEFQIMKGKPGEKGNIINIGLRMDKG